MNFSLFLKSSYAVGVLTGYPPVWQYLHLQVPVDWLLVISMVSFIIFKLLAVYEIATAERPGKMEKVAWVLGIIIPVWTTGIIYLVAGRKHISDFILFRDLEKVYAEPKD